MEDSKFKHEVMLSLFFAINLREVECAKTILNVDIDMISKILKTLRENGEEIMKKRAERLKSKQRKKAAMLKK